MPVFLIYILCFVFSLRKFEFGLYPDTTPDDPAYKVATVFQPLDKFPVGTRYLIQVMDSLDVSTANIISETEVTIANPYIKIVKTSGNIFSDDGEEPFYFRISAWEEGVRLTNDSDIREIYWDFRYPNFEFNLTFENIGPGEVIVQPQGSDLFWKQTSNFKYFIYINEGVTGPIQTDNHFLHSRFDKPGIRYFYGYGLNGWRGKWGLYPGQGSYTEKIYFALVCCENNDCSSPEYDIDWSVAGQTDGKYIHYLNCSIPNNKQLPFIKSNIEIIEQAPMWINLGTNFYLEPNLYIMIEKPIFLKESKYEPVGTFNLQILSITEDETMTYYHFKRNSGPWGFSTSFEFILFFVFGEGVSLGKEYYFGIKYDDDSPYQKLGIIPQRIIPLEQGSYSRNSHIVTGFTFVHNQILYYYEDYMRFNEIGFNMIHEYYRYQNEDYLLNNLSFYLPENRINNDIWDPNFRFFSTIPIFNAFSDLGIEGLYNILTSPTLDASKLTGHPFYFSGERLEFEVSEWNNSIEYYKNFGSLDVCYNGSFYHKHLEVFEKFFEILQPEYIEFDVEMFLPQKYPVANLENHGEPKNCEKHRREGESSEDLYVRLAKRKVLDFSDIVNRHNTNSRIVWYGVKSMNNFQTFVHRDVFAEGNMIPQIELYVINETPEIIQLVFRSCREYQQYSGQETELFGLYSMSIKGETTRQAHFDSLVQVFTNGGNGIMYYREVDFYDGGYFLSLNKAIGIFSKYEEVIRDGEVGFYDFQEINNFTLGSMRLDSTYLIGITPIRMRRIFNHQETQIYSGSFKLKYPGEIEYSLKNLNDEWNTRDDDDDDSVNVEHYWESGFIHVKVSGTKSSMVFLVSPNFHEEIMHDLGEILKIHFFVIFLIVVLMSL